MDLSSVSLVYIASSMIAQATGRDPGSNNHSPPKNKKKRTKREVPLSKTPLNKSISMTSSRPRDEP